MEFGAQGVVVQQLGAQFEPHDGCLQAVRDAQKQPLPVHQIALDARLHLIEGARGAAQLGGAGLGHAFRCGVAAKGIGGGRNAVQRTNEPTHQ